MSALTPAVNAIIKVVQIEDVRLLDVSAKTSVPPGAEIPEVTIDTSRSARVARQGDAGMFVVHVVIETKAVGAEKKDTLFCARAGFELTYQLSQALTPTAEDLQNFAEINGVFNIWSYWRELVQSMTARMGLPPLVLPVFRLEDALKSRPISERLVTPETAAAGMASQPAPTQPNPNPNPNPETRKE